MRRMCQKQEMGEIVFGNWTYISVVSTNSFATAVAAAVASMLFSHGPSIGWLLMLLLFGLLLLLLVVVPLVFSNVLITFWHSDARRVGGEAPSEGNNDSEFNCCKCQ